MANKEYFRGCRLEDFTGWGGTGTPSFGSVTLQDGAQTNTLDTIHMAEGPAIANGLRGCLWGSFTDPDSKQAVRLNDFWFTFEYRLSLKSSAWNSGGYWTNPDMQTNTSYAYAAFVLHSSTDPLMLMLRPAWNTNTFKLYMGPSVSDNTTLTDLNLKAYTSDGKYHRHSFQIQGGGTPNGVINWYIDGTLWDSYTGDFSAFRNFGALSFHGDVGTGSTEYGGYNTHRGDFTYAFVTNYKTIRAYLDYRVATAIIGTTTWAGDNKDFPTYPLQLNTLAGYYSDTNGQAITPKFNKTFTAAAVFYPKSVATQVAVSQQQLLDGTGLSLSAAQGTGTGRSIGSLITDGDGSYRLMTSVDPSNQKDWTTDSLNATNITLTRAYLDND